MIYEVMSGQIINWNALGAERKAQNVVNLINTVMCEVPFNRDKGIDESFIDGNLNEVKNKIVENAYDLINKFEPTVKIKSITLTKEENPKLKVVIDI